MSQNRIKPEQTKNITYRRDGRPVYWIPCGYDGCKSLIDAHCKNRNPTGRCADCAGAFGYLFGHAVKAKRIWDLREKIVGMTAPSNNVRRGDYLLRCETEGCEKTLRMVSFLSRKAVLCFDCSQFKKRKRPFERAYNHFKKNVTRRRNVDCSLTYEQFAKIIRIGRCHYCDADIERDEYYKETSGLRSVSPYIDRLDSAKGYTAENTVPCCPSCNFIKGPYLSETETLLVMALRSGDMKKAQKLLAQGVLPGANPVSQGWCTIKLKDPKTFVPSPADRIVVTKPRVRVARFLRSDSSMPDVCLPSTEAKLA